MSKDDLNETLESIAKTREPFYRDTGLYLKALDNLEEINRNLQRAISGEVADEPEKETQS